MSDEKAPRHSSAFLKSDGQLSSPAPSSEAFAEGPTGVFAAWDTEWQIYFSRIQPGKPAIDGRVHTFDRPGACPVQLNDLVRQQIVKRGTIVGIDTRERGCYAGLESFALWRAGSDV